MTSTGSERPWVPRLVALDVDGTVLRYEQYLGPPSQPVCDAVARVRDSGAHVVVATGRSLRATTRLLDQLGVTSGLAVCSNGAVVVDVAARTPVHLNTFDALEPVRYFADRVPDALLAVEELGVAFRITPGFDEFGFDGEVTVVSHDDLVQGPVTRLVVRWPNGDRDHLRALAEAMQLPAVDYAIGFTAWLDIMPPGISKASGLDTVCELLAVSPADTLAVGDGMNDLQMLGWARLGVAMGNAPLEVQVAADEVCGHVDIDGLAHLLGRWF